MRWHYMYQYHTRNNSNNWTCHVSEYNLTIHSKTNNKLCIELQDLLAGGETNLLDRGQNEPEKPNLDNYNEMENY